MTYHLNTLLGVAVADALGAATEFKDAADIQARWPDGFTTFQWGSPFNFEPGEATDDTQMTLATLFALRVVPPAAPLHCAAEAALTRYLRWAEADPPDIGVQTRLALRARSPVGGLRGWLATECEAAGNGGLMRAAAPFIHGLRGEALTQITAVTTALTHPDPRCVLGSVLLAALLERLSAGQAYAPAVRDALDLAVTYLTSRVLDDFDRAGLYVGADGHTTDTETRRVVHVNWKAETALAVDVTSRAVSDALRGELCGTSGYTVTTLQNALATGHAGTYLDVVLPHVLRGGDSDTIAAVAGAIAGARGLDIPEDLASTVRAGHHWDGWDRRWLLREAASRTLGRAAP
ncbi:ADP-ribosylglycohydrolase family protein [Deinococcus soli (ex Cha et al. 2016)]|uniref:ADP-ribosylglycohydrolase n=2 Tax=Deinococcus soli (ex Cha et al. 2016) TaxID=1309411 RepID=A0ACC6KGT1_9DEIO|nr:ADP-ribosylglycohydrolase family protein [Deinococcus soli (ex Cha et al. 2016)]MDR6218123.1 ADP-ribosylglycohydrolase [Deinococcus soli (ex Cha et al. 2016)]MDR6328863.1 ADP-ribosylglycohydrolase [Deinococcus soli (ex Cha et al. 2016)]MDR6751649.1 ADP-ribosylglycohydrolase [Deinococcus soli (ex Cha et al. 2016)]